MQQTDSFLGINIIFEILNLLYATYYWPPSGGPGVQRSLKFAKYLPDFGIKPIIITVDDQQAAYQLRDESLLTEIPGNLSIYKTDTFEPFGLYAKLSRTKELPKPGFAGEKKSSISANLGRFIRGNFFVPDARRGWNKYLINESLKLISSQNIDALLTSSPPHSTQLAGLKIKKKTGIKWIADLRDPWTDIYFYQDLYHLPFIKALDQYYEKKALIHADLILVVSEDIKKLFSQKSPEIDPGKIIVIPNGYDTTDFHAQKLKQKNNRLKLLYTGTMSGDYNINALADILSEQKKLLKANFHIIGSIAPAIQENMRKKLGNSFVLESHIQHDKAILEMQEANILLLVIPQTKNNKGILTGKIFEYLAAGNPILGIGPPEGDAAKILEYCNAGKMFDYDDAEGIKGFLEEICHENFQFKPRLDRVAEFSRKMLTEKLAKELKKLIHP